MVAITSLAFIFVDVPEPVWKTSTGKCSSKFPSATLIEAEIITSFISSSIIPNSAFAAAAPALIYPSARMKERDIGIPLIGKLRTALCVLAPHNADFGTSISPIVSDSVRV